MLADARNQDLAAINEFDKYKINSFLLGKLAAEEFKKTKCYSYIRYFGNTSCTTSGKASSSGPIMADSEV
jgi:hypothetical protein